MNLEERHKRITETFLEACRLSPDRRSAFLDDRCADDPFMRAEVERMLEQDAAAPLFLEPPPDSSARSPQQAVEDTQVPCPHNIRDYKIERVIGRGGMGIVYLAEQKGTHRQVALKVIRPEMTTARMLDRFEREVEILGRLQHPGIAQILEADVIDGDGGRQPFFAMEYIEGRPLTDYADNRRLGIRARLALVVDICHAVQHAHQKAIIHRDLKPGNILVDDTGHPKVLDFGIARATDSDVQATTANSDIPQLMGTLAFMSPEQLDGDPGALDTRSDVYSLGVICYRLLAGRLPHDFGTTIYQAIRVVKEDAPIPLGSVNRACRGDLATIVHKALYKSPDGRYQSASDFAADIDHFLRDEPIVARSASTFYRLRKFAKRNRALVFTGCLAVAALFSGTIVSMWQAQQARNQAKRAAEAEELAQAQVSFLSDILSEANPDKNALRDITLLEVLQGAAKRLEGRYTNQPEAEAALRRTLGYTFLTLRDFAAAETQLKRQRELLESLPNTEPNVKMDNSHWLARALVEQGRWQEAAPLLQESLAYMRNELGMDNMRTLGMTLTYARYYKGVGDIDEAVAVYREILDTVKRIRSADHPLALICMAELADVHKMAGRLDLAEKLLSEVVEGRRRILGADNKDTLTAMNNLATVYMKTKNYDRARELLEVVLPAQRRIWGDNHEQALISQMNLVKVLLSSGDYREAEPLCRDAVSRIPEALGADNYLALDATLCLGNILRLQEAWGEGVSVFTDLIARRRAVGDTGAMLEHALAGRGVCLTKLGRFAEAEADLLEAERLLVDGAEPAGDSGRPLADVFRDLYQAWGKPDTRHEPQSLSETMAPSTP